jgi:hypothetical protein
MDLISEDKRTRISIDRVDPENPYGGFFLQAEIVLSNGCFRGVNDSVHFSAISAFKSKFEQFLRSREGSVVLDATEDCNIEFYRWNAKGDIGVRFTVSKNLYDRDPTQACPVVLSGSFKLEGEYVNLMATQLLQLLDA